MSGRHASSILNWISPDHPTHDQLGKAFRRFRGPDLVHNNPMSNRNSGTPKRKLFGNVLLKTAMIAVKALRVSLSKDRLRELYPQTRWKFALDLATDEE